MAWDPLSLRSDRLAYRQPSQAGHPLAPTGPEGLFSEAEANNICHLLDLIKMRAMAAQAA
jgi:hypothetical protein